MNEQSRAHYGYDVTFYMPPSRRSERSFRHHTARNQDMRMRFLWRRRWGRRPVSTKDAIALVSMRGEDGEGSARLIGHRRRSALVRSWTQMPVAVERSMVRSMIPRLLMSVEATIQDRARRRAQSSARRGLGPSACAGVRMSWSISMGMGVASVHLLSPSETDVHLRRVHGSPMNSMAMTIVRTQRIATRCIAPDGV